MGSAAGKFAIFSVVCHVRRQAGPSGSGVAISGNFPFPNFQKQESKRNDATIQILHGESRLKTAEISISHQPT